ncbi:MAG: hypothetical protein KGY51_11225 [Psychroflexus sp.]|nr:hypothetical protein [Psychroflexus sp.]
MEFKNIKRKEFIAFQKKAINKRFSPFANFMNDMQGWKAVDKNNNEIPRYILFWSWKIRTKQQVKNNIFLSLKTKSYE